MSGTRRLACSFIGRRCPPPPPTRRAGPARRRRGALGPQMGDGLGRVGQHQHPPPVGLHDPHTVGRVHEPLPGLLHDTTHDQALDGPGRREITLEDVCPRNPRVDLAEGELCPRHQPDQPHERRRAVEDAAAELRHDEATAPVAAEDGRLLATDAREIVGRRVVSIRPASRDTPPPARRSGSSSPAAPPSRCAAPRPPGRASPAAHGRPRRSAPSRRRATTVRRPGRTAHRKRPATKRRSRRAVRGPHDACRRSPWDGTRRDPG